MRALVLAVRHPGLRLLLSAGLVSLTGDWVLRIGLAYHVYALTGDTLASALMLLASFVPQIALGSLAGVFVDRWNLRRTMVTANVLLAVGLLPLLAVDRPDQIWIVYAVVAWEGCVQQFFAPAEQSVLPRLVGPRDLLTANALNSQNADLSRLIGSALGGAAAATGGITLLAAVDAASFLLSAALLTAIRIPAADPATAPDTTTATPKAETPKAEPPRLRNRLARLRAEWVDGVRLSVRERVLRTVILTLLVTCVGEGVMSTLFAPFVRSVLHASATDYGLITAAQAVGGIAGGLLAAALGHRLPVGRTLGWAAIAFGLVDLAMFLYPLAYVAAWPALVLMIIVGLPGALMSAAAMTLLQRHTTDGNRGRVFGALGTVEGIAIVAGTCAAGVLTGTVGIVPMLAVQGAGYVVAGALLTVLLRHDDARDPAPIPALTPAQTPTPTAPEPA